MRAVSEKFNVCAQNVQPTPRNTATRLYWRTAVCIHVRGLRCPLDNFGPKLSKKHPKRHHAIDWSKAYRTRLLAVF